MTNERPAQITIFKNKQTSSWFNSDAIKLVQKSTTKWHNTLNNFYFQ